MITFEDYIQNGIKLFACNADKSPRTSHGFKDAALSAEGLGTMAGMPCGEIVVIDIDAKNEPGLFDRFCQTCKDLSIDLSIYPLARTPNGGGAHLFFRPATEIRNMRLAANEQDKTTIETRGSGGYVCVAPSIGYRMERGAVWDAPQLDIEQQDVLLSACRSLNRKDQPAWEPKKAPWERTQGTAPGDDYNRKGDVFELLRSHGWHAIDAAGTRWRRPGKSTGISATWDKVPGKFYVFTSSSQLEPGKAYSPFALYTILEHGGDFSASARALALSGYGEDAQPDNGGVDLSGIMERIDRLQKDFANVATPPRGDGLFIDLAPILAGDMSPELPTVCPSDDGLHHLFYAGRLNELHAEPGVGKTNVLLAAIARVINEDRCVVFIDPEDNPRAIVRRLISMGADRNKIEPYFKYLHDPDKDALVKARLWVQANPTAMVAIDGAAELISGTGGSERDEDDVLRFFKLYVRPFADAGACVVISDHVAKDSESAGLWPRGSGAKMGRYDGAVYLIREDKEYSPSQAGSVKLVIAKDRNGGVGAKKSNAFVIKFEPIEDYTKVIIEKPNIIKNEEPDSDIEKRILIMKALEGGAVLTAKELNKAVGGKTEYINKVRDTMAEEGYIEVRKVGAQQVAIRSVRMYLPCYQGMLKTMLRGME